MGGAQSHHRNSYRPAGVPSTVPSVSVIIPTYERRKQVEACIRSIWRQRHTPDEILLVDDSPSDAIERLTRELRDGPVPVRYLHNPGRPSLTRARNHGIDNTAGDIVCFFDSDSLPEPDYIERAVAVLAQRPEALAVRGIESSQSVMPPLYRAYRWLFCQGISGGKTIRIGFPPTFTRYPVELPGVTISDSMRGSNMVIRRKAFQLARFDPEMERYSFFEDIDFALALRRAKPDCILCDPKMLVNHPRIEAGRIPDDDLFLMVYANKHYLAHKYYRVGPRRALKLWWSDLGYVIMHSQRSWTRLRLLWPRHRRVKQLLRRHRRDLREGRLAPLNQYYSFMKGPEHGLAEMPSPDAD